MRFWPMRRRPTSAVPPSDDLVLVGDILRRNVDDILAVYDNGEKNGVFVFRGQLVTSPARALEILRDELVRAMQLTGVTAVGQIGPELIAPSPAGATPCP